MSRARFTLLVLLGACGGKAPASVAPPPAPIPAAAPAAPAPTPTPPAQRLAADTPMTSSTGNTLTAPADWSVAASGPKTVVSAPEGNLSVVLFESTDKTAEAAVDAAWTAYDPARKPPLKRSQPGPPQQLQQHEGWDEIKTFVYETSPNERRVALAIARRRGEAWTVAILDGANATFEKRLAQMVLMQQTLRPKGYEPESFAGRKPHPLDADRIKELGAFVDRARDQLGIPGVAVGLIDQGKVVFVGGFGVRELGKPQQVDADTLFLVASNTKALTTLMLAKLVDQKKIGWDTPIKSLYPSFRLGDDATTAKVQVKHLICACTGLPRQDLEWLLEFKNTTPAAEIERLGTMQPTSDFGAMFQYSNPLASAGGYVGGHVLYPKRELGAAYDEAMRTLVFGPLGMKSATFDIVAAQKRNHARPHSEDVDGKPAVAKMDMNKAVIPIRPAGGGWISARDLLRYLQMELARGKLPDGKQYISEEALLARRERQVTIGESTAYGMGLQVETKYQIPVVHHGGSMIGYKSDMMFLPDHGVGAVVLTNSDSGQLLLWPFQRRLLEILFDGRPEAEQAVTVSAAQRKAAIAKERERLVVPADPALAGQLARRYRSDELGEIAVRQDGSATVFDFGEWSSQVASRTNDDGTTSFITIDPGSLRMELVVADRDGKRALIIRDAQHEYVFREATR